MYKCMRVLTNLQPIEVRYKKKKLKIVMACNSCIALVPIFQSWLFHSLFLSLSIYRSIYP